MRRAGILGAFAALAAGACVSSAESGALDFRWMGAPVEEGLRAVLESEDSNAGAGAFLAWVRERCSVTSPAAVTVCGESLGMSCSASEKAVRCTYRVAAVCRSSGSDSCGSDGGSRLHLVATLEAGSDRSGAFRADAYLTMEEVI